jgi:hypothetical protein
MVFQTRRLIRGAAHALVVLSTMLVHAADTPRAENALLDALQGKWTMSGTVMGKPVRYNAEGIRALKGAFLRLHMIDAASPPQYEAELYMGYDPKAGDYVAHWLDAFGAAGARVVGKGSRQDNRIVIEYPYAEGAFRNTFTWDAGKRSWTLLIEAQQADKRWATFASYAFERAK